MIPDRVFAQITLDEQWFWRGRDPDRRTRAIEKGVATVRTSGDQTHVRATTDISATDHEICERLFPLEFLESHRDDLLDRLRRAPEMPELRVRIIFSHSVETEPHREILTSILRLEIPAEPGSHTVLTTPAGLDQDLAFLQVLASHVSYDTRSLEPLPTFWTRGTGGVLLHEAIGHPAGLRPDPGWPDWLRVVDDPSVSIFDTLLEGSPAGTSDLRVSAPTAYRRASFRDHPMPRLTSLVASTSRQKLDLPTRHLRILETEGGSWDPLTDDVHVQIGAAELVENDSSERVAPFIFRASRSSIARALIGGGGEPVRYPGVLCSEHGQRLPVGTTSCDLLLEGI